MLDLVWNASINLPFSNLLLLFISSVSVPCSICNLLLLSSSSRLIPSFSLLLFLPLSFPRVFPLGMSDAYTGDRSRTCPSLPFHKLFPLISLISLRYLFLNFLQKASNRHQHSGQKLPSNKENTWFSLLILFI